MRNLSTDTQHALAAEYVLGTLRGSARARFTAMMQADPALAAVVRRWEDFLTPLALNVAPVEPRARVWQAIEARIGTRTAAKPRSFWSSLDFWRIAGVSLAGVVVALLLVLMTPRAPEGPMMIAVLVTPEQVPRMVVEQHADMMKVRPVKAWTSAPGVDLELWAIGEDGKPRSLGVVASHKETDMPMPFDHAKMKGAMMIALSREPKGGSPTGTPTTVLCSGPLAKTQRA
ncbi:anti-sigma factor [Usitatibacter palustris]|uniref:Anti-sigma K factor RskA C-terminal domain-containing protein n=1 Tax=Usitatibacter palustris TaxID=2732487 RepID=A0A6M4H8S7_9PROT|nr:anti-sigma factor [Usitatibacter palustris]QJR15712.1 hypothetical protein DSM104440_02538 [Usitatibacter palustris]